MNASRVRSLLLLALCAAAAPLAVADTGSTDFRKLDANGDGKVSLAEAKGNADLELKFETLDRNRDGMLTIEEFSGSNTPSDPSTAPGGSAGAQHMPRH